MSEEFKDEPLQLVIVKEDGMLEITVEGINFLSSLKNEQICILSITGPKQSGKSLLANAIVEKTTGFKAQSQGLWIWGRPIQLDNKAKLLLIDSEGLTKNDADAKSQKILELCILLSTCLIYNTQQGQQGINDSAVADLNSYLEFAKKIIVTTDSQTTMSALCGYFPQFIWAVRDYTSEIPTQTYLNDALALQGDIIKTLFTNRDCVFIPSSTVENESQQISPQFSQQMKSLVTKIKSTIQTKTINKMSIDGESLFGILQNYLDSINNDETPVISSALENVLLSKAKNIAEKNFEVFKTEINKQMESKYPLNFIEIYKIFFEFQDRELSKFCIDVQDILTIAQTGDYLNKLSLRMRGELDSILETNKEYYDEWFEVELKELEKNMNNNELTKLEDIKMFLVSYATELQNSINRFYEIPNSDFCKNLLLVLQKIIQEQINTKLVKLGDTINELHTAETKKADSTIENLTNNIKRFTEQLNQEKKLLEEKNKDKSELYQTYSELKTKYDKMTREIKAKEKEYTNNLNIEIQKFQKLESYYINQLKEKDNYITSLESKIEKVNKDLLDSNKESSNKANELNRENVKLHVEIERIKGQEKKGKSDVYDNKNLNLQTLFKSIQNTFMEFKESVDKLDRENENVFKTKYLELSTKEIENKSRNWIDEIRLFREDQIRAISENYEKSIKKARDEVEELSFELTKRNYSLNEEKQLKDTYLSKYDDSVKQLKELAEINSSKDKVIDTQMETLKLFEDKVNDFKKTKEELELNLNKNIVDYKMKEDEMETLIMVIQGMLSKNKDKFEHNLSRLSRDTKLNIEALVKDYKLFR